DSTATGLFFGYVFVTSRLIVIRNISFGELSVTGSNDRNILDTLKGLHSLTTYFIGYQENIDMRIAVELAWG
ncbi:MAG: hypothetical protein ACE5OQ_16695, partial [Woeseia sp.]